MSASWLRHLVRKERRPLQKRASGRRAPLQLELLEDRVTPSDMGLTLAEVHSIADAALARWVNAGATTEQVRLLQNLNYQVTDLDASNLGVYRSGVITLDINGAGNLWHI